MYASGNDSTEKGEQIKWLPHFVCVAVDPYQSS